MPAWAGLYQPLTVAASVVGIATVSAPGILAAASSVISPSGKYSSARWLK
jgi:hypothetical protein